MYCPKCNHIMGHIKFKSNIVERCINCKGMWFDHMEVEKLKCMRGSERIDSGHKKTGKSYDTIKEILCPRCKVLMTLTTPPDKDHFTYETCPKCHSVFLDAGEFKELKSEETVLGFLKNLL